MLLNVVSEGRRPYHHHQLLEPNEEEQQQQKKNSTSLQILRDSIYSDHTKKGICQCYQNVF